MKSAFLVDRQLLAGNATKNFGRRTDMDDRLRRERSERAKEPFGALDVSVYCVERRGEGGLRVALGGKVKHIVRSRGLNAILYRHRVTQISVMKLDPVAGIDAVEMGGNVVQRASPADHAVNFPAGIIKKVIEQVRANHSSHARD